MSKKDIQIENISGVDCYEKDGTAYLKLEAVARGLGFSRIAASGNEVVRWETVRKYLEELGVPTSWHENPKPTGKDGLPEFIPENIFYRLAMKAKNDTAEKFQAKVADEIIPTIRKTGGYVNDDEVFINTYLPFADEATKLMFRSTLSTVRKLNDIVENQKKEIGHKQDVITGLTDEITLAEKSEQIIEFASFVIPRASAWREHPCWCFFVFIITYYISKILVRYFIRHGKIL